MSDRWLQLDVGSSALRRAAKSRLLAEDSVERNRCETEPEHSQPYRRHCHERAAVPAIPVKGRRRQTSHYCPAPIFAIVIA